MLPTRAPFPKAGSYAYDPAWRQLPDADDRVGQAVALVAGATLFIATLVLWLLLAPFQPVRIDYATLIIGVGVVLLLHEFAHAVAFVSARGQGLRVEWVWHQRRPQLRYEGALSRTHYLVMLAAPLFALSLAPIAGAMMLGLQSGDLALISLLNAVVSGGDLVAALVVLHHVPPGATMRRHGDTVLWREHSAGATDTATLPA